MKHLVGKAAEDVESRVSLPQPIHQPQTQTQTQDPKEPAPETQEPTRHPVSIPTPGRMNPRPELQPEPKEQKPPATPPPPPDFAKGRGNENLVRSEATGRATAFHTDPPDNPYRSIIDQGDEESREVLRNRDKEDYEYSLKTYLYQPETGNLYSKKSKKLLQSVTGDKKRKVLNFRGRRIYQHDLAYLMTIGHWPEERIKHVRDTLDNRWDNLRLQSHWTPALKPEPKPVPKKTLHGEMTNEEIEAKAVEIPRHVLEGRKYPISVQEIVELFEFRGEGKEGVLISKRTGREVAKPKENSKGRHRIVFVTPTIQMRAHIVSYALYYRKFPKGNLGARDGNKCNIHPSNLQPLWGENRKDV